MEHKQIIELVKTLRESADIIHKIYTEGSCFRLYMILKVICPDAIAYWSDRDNHCITKIGEKFYDIGGEVNPKFINDLSYYEVPKEQLEGYSLFKWTHPDHSYSVRTEKYTP